MKESDGDITNLQETKYFKYIMFLIVFLIVLIALFGSFYIVPAGDRGVLLTFGKPTLIAKGEGLGFKMPLIQQVIKMDVKTQKFEVSKASAASKDLQTVTTDVAINYYINPDSVVEIYRTIGLGYQDKIMSPAVQEIVKASTAQYTAEELVTKRPEIKDKIDSGLRERLSKFGFNVQAVSITDFDFSDQFNSAIESKVTAEQNALAAKNKLAQVEYEAQQRVTQAKAEAEAIRIQAEAITRQGGANYVELQRIQKWDGRYPIVMGSGISPIVDVRGLSTGVAAATIITSNQTTQ